MKLFGFNLFRSTKLVEVKGSEDKPSVSKKSKTNKKINETALRNFMVRCKTIASECKSYSGKVSNSPINRLVKKGDDFFTVGKIKWVIYSFLTPWADSKKNLCSLIGTLSENQKTAIGADNWELVKENNRAFMDLNENFSEEIKGQQEYIDFLKSSIDALKNKEAPLQQGLNISESFEVQLEAMKKIVIDNSKIKEFEEVYEKSFKDVLAPAVTPIVQEPIPPTFEEPTPAVVIEPVVEQPPAEANLDIKNIEKSNDPFMNAYNNYSAMLENISTSLPMMASQRNVSALAQTLYEITEGFNKVCDIDAFDSESNIVTNHDNLLSEIQTKCGELRNKVYIQFSQLFQEVYGESLENMDDTKLQQLIHKFEEDEKTKERDDLLDVCAVFANLSEIDENEIKKGVDKQFLFNVREKIPHINF